MKCSFERPLRYMLLCLGISLSTAALAQDTTAPKRPVINLDKELEGPVAQDRALSYYHFSLAMWFEDSGDLKRAISEMQTALKYNENSAAVHLEMATLLHKTANVPEAISHAEEAARLDPNDPDPHWFLANIYFRQPGGDGLQKAVAELEKLKTITPDEERIYFHLGQAYFALDKPDLAIQALEKFQSLSTNTDIGYKEIAKYYERNRNEEKVLEYMQKAVKAQPSSGDSLAVLAGIYMRQGKYKEALPLYRKLSQLDPANIEVKQSLAVTLIELRQYGEALNILDDLSKSPIIASDTLFQTMRGKAQFGLRRYSDAIKTLKGVTEKNPDALEASFYLARSYEETGKFDESAKIFEKLLEKPSEEAKANRAVFQQQLASDYIALGRHDKAILIYQEMAKTDSKRANPHILEAYRLAKQYDKAIAFGKEQFEKDPDNIELGISYGRALADAGKAKQGAEVLTGLLQSHPDNIEIYVHLSQICLQDKRYKDAVNILKKAERITSDRENNERLKIHLAAAYEKAEEIDEAESVLREILKANPQNSVALNHIGYMLADRGVRLEEAVKYVEEALAIEPENGAYLDSLGWAFFKLNDLEKAEKYLLKAGEIVRDDPTIEEHLGDLYFKTGDYQKAEEYYKRSIKVGTEPEEIQKVRRKLDDTLRKRNQAR